ncbi:aminopeptidase P family protein [Halorubellus sp. JP-L1]|uniref:M24 family metallopeptidase n=1 Tax=Halorubellus sp. JP-L1 TaxID=2715753 RepID=UPI00140C69EA|nr:Xaa-Pro peptidase family protein [Halorubellus sp. JP-L1]NHN40085.1 aminopeptidase P family protein [Halorubellus sp. JP-L1]
MEPDLSGLDAYLDEQGVDGYAFFDDDSNSDLYYTTGFGAPDPFFAVYTPEETAILVSSLEYGRARKESRADVVERQAAYDPREKREEYGEELVQQKVVSAFLEDVGVESVATQFGFPAGLADGLREEGVTVDPEYSRHSEIMGVRAVKTDEELEHVRDAQKANEEAMRAAEALIRDASVEDGVLYHDGEALTSERVTEEIEVTLLRQGCALDETIVACGSDAADPHDRGGGPLEAGETIIVDIFPRSKATKYHADMTRTFVKGDATETQKEWHAVTDEARKAALDAVEAGVSGEEVNQAVVDVYQDAGHPTVFTDPETETGFIHSTGHGVGLDVHEAPSISRNGPELEAGHVITIEPGLYDPAVGGVRIEDIVVVTEDGYENLTDYPIELEVE